MLLVDQGLLESVRNVGNEGVLPECVSVVVFDEDLLLLIVPFSNIGCHFNNLVNIKSGDFEELQKVDGSGWWRSIDPSCKRECLLIFMSIYFLRLVFLACSFHVVAFDIQLAVRRCLHSLLNVSIEFLHVQGVTHVFSSI